MEHFKAEYFKELTLQYKEIMLFLKAYTGIFVLDDIIIFRDINDK